MNSLPVAFGIDGAKYICAATIDVTQLSVAAYLYAGLHEPVYAAVLLGLTLPQVSKCTASSSVSRLVMLTPSRLVMLKPS
jgi:4-hydroxybenzoate polyprenyltransferase